jgi:hypothetical protein
LLSDLQYFWEPSDGLVPACNLVVGPVRSCRHCISDMSSHDSGMPTSHFVSPEKPERCIGRRYGFLELQFLIAAIQYLGDVCLPSCVYRKSFISFCHDSFSHFALSCVLWFCFFILPFFVMVFPKHFLEVVTVLFFVTVVFSVCFSVALTTLLNPLFIGMVEKTVPTKKSSARSSTRRDSTAGPRPSEVASDATSRRTSPELRDAIVAPPPSLHSSSSALLVTPIAQGGVFSSESSVASSSSSDSAFVLSRLSSSSSVDHADLPPGSSSSLAAVSPLKRAKVSGFADLRHTSPNKAARTTTPMKLIYIIFPAFLQLTSAEKTFCALKTGGVYNTSCKALMYWVDNKTNALAGTSLLMSNVVPGAVYDIQGLTVRVGKSGPYYFVSKTSSVTRVEDFSATFEKDACAAVISSLSPVSAIGLMEHNSFCFVIGRVANVTKQNVQNVSRTTGSFNLYDGTGVVTITVTLQGAINLPFLGGNGVGVLCACIVERVGGSVKLVLQSIVSLDDLPVLLGLCTSGKIPKLVSASFDPSGLVNLATPPRGVRAAVDAPLPEGDDEWFRNVTIKVLSFKVVPVYLGCVACLKKKGQHRVDQPTLSCPACGVLDVKDIVACSHSVISCEIDGVYVDDVFCTKNQWRALFTKTEEECMSDGLSDEESCVGKTLTGTFLISAVKKMLMGLERVVDDDDAF